MSFSFLGALFRRNNARRYQPEARFHPRGMAAVIIPAHNEAALIERTLRSVLRAFHSADVYVFCDRCTDTTAEIARRYLPRINVIESQRQMGKSGGIEYVLRNYVEARNYLYVTIIDADTEIAPDYLTQILPVVSRKDVACAVGQVKSQWRKSNIISLYRTYVYALWQAIHKRFQGWTNSVTIASGCSTTWKVSVMSQLEFDHRLSTEDFDLTIQVHRKHLGRIAYVHKAVVWTQDPFTIATYRKQMQRWVRAWWEVVRKHKLGLRIVRVQSGRIRGLSAIDLITALLTAGIISSIALLASIVLGPLLLFHPVPMTIGPARLDSRADIVWLMLWQWGAIVVPAILAAIFSRRILLLLVWPLFLLFMYIDVFVTIGAITSTLRSLYRRLPASSATLPPSAWQSPERRAS
ncbi:MAG TPA: glycosyltransferase [Chloroflexota bacterium]|nr:glycosyltransferase [Chloroflexota bacterium]